jgi:hypothetical protein
MRKAIWPQPESCCAVCIPCALYCRHNCHFEFFLAGGRSIGGLAVNLVLMRLRKKSLPVFSIEAIPDTGMKPPAKDPGTWRARPNPGGRDRPDKSRTMHPAVTLGFPQGFCLA